MKVLDPSQDVEPNELASCLYCGCYCLICSCNCNDEELLATLEFSQTEVSLSSCEIAKFVQRIPI